MEVSGQLHALASLCQGKSLHTHRKGGWVEHRVVLDVVAEINKYVCPYRESNLGQPDNRQFTDQSSGRLISQNKLLTPWCRTLFEKLIVTQLVKKYPAFFMEPEGSLLCSQKSATRLYPEPAKSTLPH
jgi:hypothetical protein